MTDVVQKTESEIQAEAYALFTDWLQDRSNIEKLVAALLKPSIKLESELELLRDALDVEQATGDALDRLGERVGEARQNRTDAVYRTFVKGRIITNLSKGDAESIFASARALVDSTNTLEITDYYPASFHLDVANSAPELIYDMFIQIKDAKAAGVRMTGVAHHAAATAMFTIGDVASYPETDNGTGVGNEGATIGGEFAGSISEDWINRRNHLVLERKLNSWTEIETPLSQGWVCAYDPDTPQWIMGGGVVPNGALYTSPDTVNWTSRTLPSNKSIFALDYNNGVYAAGGWSIGEPDSFIIRSDDGGVTWTEQSTPTHSSITYTINYLNGQWLAAGNVETGGDALLMTSPDAITWTQRANTAGAIIYDISYAANTYVAVGQNGFISTSPDGITWTPQTSPKAATLYSIDYGAGLFVAMGVSDGIDTYVITSPDGINWTERSTPSNATINRVRYTAGAFVGIGNNTVSVYNSLILTSRDGVVWKQRVAIEDIQMYGIAHDGTNFLATGAADAELSAHVLKTNGIL